MSREKAPPIFLERRSYRQRRMLDALRLIPLFGLMLWTVPLFWSPSTENPQDQMSMSDAVVYVFLIWVLLILMSASLSRVLRPSLRRDNGGARATYDAADSG